MQYEMQNVLNCINGVESHLLFTYLKTTDQVTHLAHEGTNLLFCMPSSSSSSSSSSEAL